MVRGFNWLAWKETDILKHSSRPEWPAFLHNLAYLHGALRLRARFGRGGWNVPSDFMRIGNTEFTASDTTLIKEHRKVFLEEIQKFTREVYF